MRGDPETEDVPVVPHWRRIRANRKDWHARRVIQKAKPRMRLCSLRLLVEKARDLALELCRLPELSERSGVIEELALQFGGQRAPAHDHGRSEIFENFLFFGCRRAFLPARQECRRAAFVFPAGEGCGVVVRTRVFCRHLLYMECANRVFQWPRAFI